MIIYKEILELNYNQEIKENKEIINNNNKLNNINEINEINTKNNKENKILLRGVKRYKIIKQRHIKFMDDQITRRIKNHKIHKLI